VMSHALMRSTLRERDYIINLTCPSLLCCN